MKILVIERGSIPPDPVAPDSLKGIPRQQTNPGRWKGETWQDFVDHLRSEGVVIRQERSECSVFVTDSGGLAYGLPHGIVRPRSAEDISKTLKAAQIYKVPVTTRG